MKMDPTNGVSEVIGVILLISLVIIAIAIIGAFLFSQQTPQQIPNLNFMTGSDGNGNLLLFHNGGDSLTKGTFLVTVDQVPSSYTLSDGGNVWSLGKTLIVTGVSTGPHTVQIIYNVTGGSSGGVLLRTASANVSTSSLGSISPDVPQVISTPNLASYVFNDAANISNSSHFVSAIQQNVSGNSVSFFKSNFPSKGTGASGLTCNGFCYDAKGSINFTFTVTDPNTLSSNITFSGGSGRVELYNGDFVNFTFAGTDATYLTSFGVAPQIWEFAGTPLTLRVTHNGITTQYVTDGEVYHTYVRNYTNLKSTFAIDCGKSPSSAQTALIVNGTTRINSITSTTVNISNVAPVPVGLYVFSWSSSSKDLYFFGRADGIWVGGSQMNYL